MDWLNLIVIPVIRSVVIIVVLLTGFAYLTWYERKLLARFHVRYGPNRAGPKGLLQPIADAVKAIFKEEIIPGHVDKFVYLLAPALALAPALLIWAVIPLGPNVVGMLGHSTARAHVMGLGRSLDHAVQPSALPIQAKHPGPGCLTHRAPPSARNPLPTL